MSEQKLNPTQSANAGNRQRARSGSSWWNAARNGLTGSVPVSIVTALLIGGVIVGFTGVNPFNAYGAIFEGAFLGSGPANTLQRAVPLVGLAIAVAIAFRAGAFNLGGEGQIALGALAGTLVALQTSVQGPLAVIAALLAGAAAGGLWALLPVLLETKFKAPLLITSLLLNYPATALVSYVIQYVLQDPSTDQVASQQISVDNRIPTLIPAASDLGRSLAASLGSSNPLLVLTRTVNWGILIVFALVVVTVIVSSRTPAGLESSLTGKNARFSRYVGIRTGRVLWRSMFASGAISGSIGVILVLGSQFRLVEGALSATGYAFTALLIALLANSRPLGVAITGLFFAALIVGGEAAERTIGLSAQISDIIQAVVIVLIASRIALPRRRKKTSSPQVADDDRSQHDEERVGAL